MAFMLHCILSSFLLIYKFYPNLHLMDGCTSLILHKITRIQIICCLQDSILFSLAPYPFFLDLNTLKDFKSRGGGHLPYEKFLPTKDRHLEKQNVCRSFCFLLFTSIFLLGHTLDYFLPTPSLPRPFFPWHPSQVPTINHNLIKWWIFTKLY